MIQVLDTGDHIKKSAALVKVVRNPSSSPLSCNVQVASIQSNRSRTPSIKCSIAQYIASLVAESCSVETGYGRSFKTVS